MGGVPANVGAGVARTRFPGGCRCLGACSFLLWVDRLVIACGLAGWCRRRAGQGDEHGGDGDDGECDQGGSDCFGYGHFAPFGWCPLNVALPFGVIPMARVGFVKASKSPTKRASRGVGRISRGGIRFLGCEISSSNQVMMRSNDYVGR